MDKFKWHKGRQHSTYWKWPFLWVPGKMDGYLLKIPAGEGVPYHKDPAPEGFVHYRLNLILRPAKTGGKLLCHKTYFNYRFLQFFQASEESHALTPSTGTAFYLSVGWLKRKKKSSS